MHIQITKTFEDLGTTYQAGQEIHVPESLGERYIFSKVAARVIKPNKPKPRYGTPEWAQERKELDAKRVPLGTDATIPFYAVPQWSVVRLSASGVPTYAIEKLHNFDRTLYGKENPRITDASFIDSMKKAGCPAEIVQRYLKILPGPVNQEQIIEAEIQQRYKVQAAQNEQHARENGLASVILGVGK